MQLFALQCPYKLPLLKTLSRWTHWARREGTTLPRALSFWLLRRTAYGSVPWRVINTVYIWFRGAVESLDAFNEDNISRYAMWDISVILYARDVLRGERLSGSIAECFWDIADEGLKKTSGDLLDNYPPMKDDTLPGVVDGPLQAVREFALRVLDIDHFQPGLPRLRFNPGLLAMLYKGLASAQSTAYNPEVEAFVIPSHSIPVYIDLIGANPISATFSFLAMYSIQHRALTDHPGTFSVLLERSFYPERQLHGVGEFYNSFTISNLADVGTQGTNF